MQLMSELYHHSPIFFPEYGISIRAILDTSTCLKATKSLNRMFDIFAQVTLFGLFVEQVFQGLKAQINDIRVFTASLCHHDEECRPSVVPLDEVAILADLTDEESRPCLSSLAPIRSQACGY